MAQVLQGDHPDGSEERKADVSEALEVLDAHGLRRWSENALRALLTVRSEVDVLNVFPVPDADTGTNLVRTLAGAMATAGRLDDDASLAELAAAAARGALYSARGNSGIILSQALRAFAGAVADRPEIDGAGLVRALTAVASGARSAVAEPVEGTILTAADAAAAAAGAAPAGVPLQEVVTAAADAAQEALGRTTGQLSALQGRGVVDAGAAGYAILLRALATVVAGEETGARERARHARACLRHAGAAADAGRDARRSQGADDRPSPGHDRGPDHGHGPDQGHDRGAGDGHDHGAGDFEVMYVLRAGERDADALRERLGSVGASVAVVGGADGPDDGLWHVHVHTDVPLAALAPTGTMEQVCVRYLREVARGGVGIVACTRAPGLAAPLARAGAAVVLHPDRAGIARAAVDTGAHELLVLPCDDTSAALAAEVVDVPGHAAAPARPRMRLIGTRSELAVLAVVSEWVAGQSAGAQAGRAASLAARSRTTAVDVLGDGPAGGADAIRTALDGLLRADDELVTVVVGARVLAEPKTRDAVVGAVRAAVGTGAAEAELLVLDGAQARPDLLLGAE